MGNARPRGRGLGHSTARLWSIEPVVWKDRVFVTAVSGELKENLHVLAIDLATGSTLWQKDFEATQKVKDSDAVSAVHQPRRSMPTVYWSFLKVAMSLRCRTTGTYDGNVPSSPIMAKSKALMDTQVHRHYVMIE